MRKLLFILFLGLVFKSQAQNHSRNLGGKSYEISNHLGNVMAVVSDRKLNIADNTSLAIASSETDILSYNDYYPYGMLMDGRNKSKEYRYGFQGQEKDDEVKGKENSVNYKYRVHDVRLGRFFAVDPLSAKYPFYSQYAFSGNRVIDRIELEGLETGVVTISGSGVNQLFLGPVPVAFGVEIGLTVGLGPDGITFATVANGLVGEGQYLGVTASLSFYPTMKSSKDILNFGMSYCSKSMFVPTVNWSSGKFGINEMEKSFGTGVFYGVSIGFTGEIKSYSWGEIIEYINKNQFSTIFKPIFIKHLQNVDKHYKGELVKLNNQINFLSNEIYIKKHNYAPIAIGYRLISGNYTEKEYWNLLPESSKYTTQFRYVIDYSSLDGQGNSGHYEPFKMATEKYQKFLDKVSKISELREDVKTLKEKSEKNNERLNKIKKQ